MAPQSRQTAGCLGQVPQTEQRRWMYMLYSCEYEGGSSRKGEVPHPPSGPPPHAGAAQTRAALPASKECSTGTAQREPPLPTPARSITQRSGATERSRSSGGGSCSREASRAYSSPSSPWEVEAEGGSRPHAVPSTRALLLTALSFTCACFFSRPVRGGAAPQQRRQGGAEAALPAAPEGGGGGGPGLGSRAEAGQRRRAEPSRLPAAERPPI
mmetsp:Transcript_24747/g.83469  ORF Transcript_24747/g.83469 Transcript_24747/m.83469 type:complete len:213 (-) Transcript_24747:215-853(-)